MVGLMATSSQRAYAIPALLHPEPCPCGRPLLTRTSTGDTQTQFWLSLCEVSESWCAQVCLSPPSVSGRVWGLILNVILPLLLSCWGFSFAPRREVSFSGGIQHSPVNGCSAASCNFGVLKGEDERTSIYSAIFLHHGHLGQKTGAETVARGGSLGRFMVGHQVQGGKENTGSLAGSPPHAQSHPLTRSTKRGPG